MLENSSWRRIAVNMYFIDLLIMSREIKYCSTSYAVQQELTVVC